MELSVVILTWNSERYITKCLQSVIGEIAHGSDSAEIHIVDNGSTDATPDMLKELHAAHPSLIFPTFLDTNTGTTYPRNLALKKASGRYICIMDSDVELSSGTFQHLITVLQRDSQVGLVAPRLTYPNGTLQKSTDDFPTISRKIERYFFLKRMEIREYEYHAHAGRHAGQEQEVDYAISAMWLFRHDLLDRVGLLDENIFYAPEDVDYCLRIWKAGYKILYSPGISCIHHTQEISRGFKITRATLHHISGLLYYFRKHHCFFTRPRFGQEANK